MPLKNYGWKRFWCPRDGIANLSDGGYLLDPDSEWGHARNPKVVPFEAIKDIPCLILLGAPGMGKSIAMKAEYDAVAKPGQPAVLLDLRAYQTDVRLENGIRNHDAIQTWLPGTQRLHLFLDSFDECPLQKNTLGALLLEILQRLPKDRLLLRIACRTADWPTDFEDGLKEAWGQDNLGVYELAPLRRPDVIGAAESNAIEPPTFLQEIDQKNVVPFAIKPVTLDFLIHVYARQKQLPRTQSEIYLEGCRLLCEETSQSRLAAKLTGTLTSEQRLQAASRIAAVSIFANRYAIWTDVDRGNVPDEDVRIRDLSGDIETAQGQQFPVTETAIQEVLSTGLFSARGECRLGWAHQSYAEYLAAYYLASHGLTRGQIKSLIIHPDDSERKLVPQLHQTAAWLAGMSEEVFREIMKTDPDVLLQSDVSTADDQGRSDLVAALLQLYDGEKLKDEFGIDKHYKKLLHPRLAEQLRAVISSKAHHPLTRRVATDMAEACELRDVQDDLVSLALDQTESLPLRTNAAYAIWRIGDNTARAKLKPLALGRAGDDPNDELKGCGLLAVWPAHLSTPELFQVVTPPKRDNFFGSYFMFLEQQVIVNLRPQDLPLALTWVKDHPNWISNLADSIMALALRHLDQPGVLGDFAQAALARIRFRHEMFGDEFGFRLPNASSIGNFFSDGAVRRKILAAVISRLGSQDETIVFRLVHSRLPLATHQDVPWLIDQLAAATSAPTQQSIVQLIWSAFDASDPELFDAVYWGCKKYPLLNEKFALLFRAVELNSPEAQKLKADYETVQEWQRQANNRPLIDPPPDQRIMLLLDQFDAGNLDAWWQLNREMTLEPTSALYGSDLISDLTSLPGWKSATPETKSRIVSTAKQYILRGDPQTVEWLGTNQIYFRAFAGYRALRLLLQEDRAFMDSLSEERWHVWTPIVVAFPTADYGGDLDVAQRLVQLAYRHAPTDVITTCLALIDKDNNQNGTIFSIYKYRECWDEPLAQALLAKAKSPDLRPDSVNILLHEFLSHRFKPAVEFAKSLLIMPLPPDGRDRQLAIIGAHALAEYEDNAGWPVIWPCIQQDASFGELLFVSLVHDRDIDLQRRLSESQLADLYIWFVRHFPPDQDPQIEGGHFVSPRESIGQWRDDVLVHLKTRGTQQACNELQRIATELPYLGQLKWVLLDAQAATRRNTWIPCRPADVVQLAQDRQKRLVQNGEQLLGVLTESLGRLQAKLQGETPAAPDLWNEISKGKFRPKDENSFSDYVKRHLDEDLKVRGIIANREVEIRRGTGGAPGERTDIQVDAVIKSPNAADFGCITAIIEAKGCWHRELDSAMETQLVGRYLCDNHCQHGLYLVGWFNCSQWDDGDDRKGQAKQYDQREALQAKLDLQAQQLSKNGILLRAVIVNATLR